MRPFIDKKPEHFCLGFFYDQPCIDLHHCGLGRLWQAYATKGPAIYSKYYPKQCHPDSSTSSLVEGLTA